MPARIAYDNLRPAVTRILVGGAPTLTARFAGLASHYLFEPCFCRPGEGHDKGGVEARGKAIRLQALGPIPSGPTFDGINAALLAQLDARDTVRRDGTRETIGARFAEEQRVLRPVDVAFVAEAATVASITPRGLARVYGAYEWAAAKHRERGTRGWKKLHLGVDRSGVIVAHVLTDARIDDATVGIDVIGAAAGHIASVTADTAYDTVAF